MARVLVTGGAGYIGSHTCKALARAGHVPIAYDNLVNGRREAVRWGPFEHGDLLDRARLDAVIGRHRPDFVIHFAAYAYVGESIAEPEKYYRNNVAGSLALLEAMLAREVRHIVFSSSCAIYGVPPAVPITETMPLAPINPYGMTKLVVERMLADFERAHGLKWIALRYFNAAGDDPDLETGEVHDPETRIVPLVLEAAAGRNAPFTIYGEDYPTPDGTCIRDYIHASDLAAAHVKALEALATGRAGGPINLGSGAGHSVRAVVAAAERITGRPVKIVTGPRRPGDPAILVADAEKARTALGWTPVLSDLDTIVATAWAWNRARHGG